MNRITLLFIFIIGCFSCQNDAPASEEETTVTQPTAKPTLPSLPLETIQYLWENCDYVDYVFYTLPISMSLNEKGSIQYVLRHISADAAPLDPNCKPIGRIFYQIKGENFLEADIFFQKGCTYFKFLKDGQATYANFMTDDGINYLNDNIAKASEMQRNAQQAQ